MTGAQVSGDLNSTRPTEGKAFLTQCRTWARWPSRKRHDAPRLMSALGPGRQRGGVRVPVYGRRPVTRFLLGLDGLDGVSRLLLRLPEFPDLAL